MPAAPKPATCHPDRLVLARGLCSVCYSRFRRGGLSAVAGGEIKRYNYSPPIETDPERHIPYRTLGVIQHVATKFPIAACPKCRSRLLEYTNREAHCAGALGGCGATIYLVREEALYEQLSNVLA